MKNWVNITFRKVKRPLAVSSAATASSRGRANGAGAGAGAWASLLFARRPHLCCWRCCCCWGCWWFCCTTGWIPGGRKHCRLFVEAAVAAIAVGQPCVATMAYTLRHWNTLVRNSTSMSSQSLITSKTNLASCWSLPVRRLQFSEEPGGDPLHDARVGKWKRRLQRSAKGVAIKIGILGDIRCRLCRPLLDCGHPLFGLSQPSKGVLQVRRSPIFTFFLF